MVEKKIPIEIYSPIILRIIICADRHRPYIMSNYGVVQFSEFKI